MLRASIRLFVLGSAALSACSAGPRPRHPANGPVFTQVAAGPYVACARRSDGAVSCWGRCDEDCGRATPIAEGSSPPPGLVPGLHEAQSIAVGERGGCALRGDGRVACWGDNDHGTFGHAREQRSATPVLVEGVSDVVEIAATASMMCARRREGAVMSWGGNLPGSDDVPEQRARRAPTVIADVTGADGLFVQGSECCAHVASGGVRCWSGAMREKSYHYDFVYGPAHAIGDAHARAVFECGCVLDDRASLTCTSWAFPGAYVPGAPSAPPVPHGCAIRHLDDVVTVAAALSSSCAVRKNGSVTCWTQGETMRSVSVPGRVRQLVMGSAQTTYALDEEGAVWAWGATSEDAIPGHAGIVETPVRVLP